MALPEPRSARIRRCGGPRRFTLLQLNRMIHIAPQ
jgi:hypothetical protein